MGFFCRVFLQPIRGMYATSIKSPHFLRRIAVKVVGIEALNQTCGIALPGSSSTDTVALLAMLLLMPQSPE